MFFRRTARCLGYFSTLAAPPADFPKFHNYPAVKLGVVSAMNSVPKEIEKPSYYFDGHAASSEKGVQIHTPEGVKKMRKACQITKKVMDFVDTLVEPGVTTDEIDKELHKYALSLGYYPAPLNFCGFPKSICSSINDVCCHGIPDSRKLQDGDILKMDMVMLVDGYNGDMTRQYAVGNVNDDGKRLMKCTEEAIQAGIKVCKNGVPYTAIGKAIESVCKKYGYNVLYDYCGHGIGTDMHQLPYILHFENDYPGIMRTNETFTIEPIIVEHSNSVYIDKDGWTVRTKDGGRAAQIEHTILVTDDGCEVLTA